MKDGVISGPPKCYFTRESVITVDRVHLVPGGNYRLIKGKELDDALAEANAKCEPALAWWVAPRRLLFVRRPPKPAPEQSL